MVPIILGIAGVVGGFLGIRGLYRSTMKKMETSYESVLRAYQERRDFLRCPACRIDVDITEDIRYHEEFECGVCGTVWEDTPTHSIIRRGPRK